MANTQICDLEFLRLGTSEDTEDLRHNFGAFPPDNAVEVLQVVCVFSTSEYEYASIVRSRINGVERNIVVEYYDDGKDHHVFRASALVTSDQGVRFQQILGRPIGS